MMKVACLLASSTNREYLMGALLNKNVAGIAASLEAIHAAGIAVKADYMFSPKLEVDGIPAEQLPLFFHRIELPVLAGQSKDCLVSISAGRGFKNRAIVVAMRDAGTFEATAYFGTARAHTGEVKLSCRFVEAKPVVLDFSARSGSASFDVVLKICAQSFEPGNVD